MLPARRRWGSRSSPEQTLTLLGEVPLRDLPEEERALADTLRARAGRLLTRQALAASLEQLQRDGEDLRALEVLEELIRSSEDADIPRLSALRSELREGVPICSPL